MFSFTDFCLAVLNFSMTERKDPDSRNFYTSLKIVEKSMSIYFFFYFNLVKFIFSEKI